MSSPEEVDQESLKSQYIKLKQDYDELKKKYDEKKREVFYF